MTKKLALHQGFRNCRTVDSNLRLLGQHAVSVKFTGNQFLARTVLSNNKSTCLGFRYLVDQGLLLFDRFALSNNIRWTSVALLNVILGYSVHLVKGCNLVHYHLNLIERKWLYDIIKSPYFHAGKYRFHWSIARHHDNHRTFSLSRSFLKQLRPFPIQQPQIQKMILKESFETIFRHPSNLQSTPRRNGCSGVRSPTPCE